MTCTTGNEHGFLILRGSSVVECHLKGGNQKVPPQEMSELQHGVSIADICIDWETAMNVLQMLENDVQYRSLRADRSAIEGAA